MNKTFLLFVFLVISGTVFSQIGTDVADSKSTKKVKPSITLYKIISAERDTTFVDTTLSMEKMYRFNYLRRDNFELLPFANVGHTYNQLAYKFDKQNLKPLFAAQSHHHNYMEISDMNYYHVPTPLTELYYKTAFNQGQQLDAFFTINTSEQFNFSIAYKGVRSLGQYQNNLSSTGNFRFTSHYFTKNKRYRIKTHIAAQDMLNEENGGLQDTSIQLFIDDVSDFKDRGRLDVNFEDGENKLEGLRFYGEHEFLLIQKLDSTSQNELTIGNAISYEDKFYQYKQKNPYDGFGPSYMTQDLKTKVKLEDLNIQGYARYQNEIIGNLSAFIGYTDYNYGYNSVLILDEGRITNRLKGNLVQAGATYEKEYRGFQLYGKGTINISGDLDANFLQAGASYNYKDEHQVKAEINIHSVAPNFNYLLYQSDYVNYNWQNNLNNVKTQQLKFELRSDKLLDATVEYTGIDDYTYFAIKANDSTPTPHQYGDRLDYLKIKLEKEFRYKNFALANTILYQEALSGETVFNVPQIITRNSLYYQDEWFKKAMFMQTGVTFKYFTKYKMNAYDPVLAEFYVQNDEELGGFPLVDIFFNAKVRQTRIFFVFEHINSLFTSKNEYFSAPGYPYRDGVIRFGIVWNFFL
jgi:hypothetical protein